MTKRDLIDEVNKRFPHLSRRDSEVIINAIFDSMVDALAQGDRIEIRGFGSFVVKQRRARQGRNPKSGALVSVAAKRVPFFKVGKELRLRVDGLYRRRFKRSALYLLHQVLRGRPKSHIGLGANSAYGRHDEQIPVQQRPSSDRTQTSRKQSRPTARRSI